MSKYINKREANTGTGASDWVLLGSAGEGRGGNKIGIQVEASGSATVSIQCTLDASLSTSDGTVVAAQINDITGLTGLTANGVYSVDGPMKAVRINQTAGAGTSAITVLQSGD